MVKEFVNNNSSKAAAPRANVRKAIAEHPAAAEQEAMEVSVSKGQNLTSEVTFYYFELMGRGDPLRQMFEYHGQPYKKVGY